MKKILRLSVLLFIFAFSYSLVLSETNNDTLNAKINKCVSSVDSLASAVKTLKANIDTLNKRTEMPKTSEAKVSCEKKELKVIDYLFVAMPVLLFLIVFFVVLIKLKKSKFDLGEALLGDVPTLITVEKSSDDGKTTTETITDVKNGETQYPKSISRFIALFSGFTSIIIALCLTTYYVFFYLECGQSPNFNNLLEVVLGLGIGVVPYAFNKINESKLK